jgi:hypothetical protein
MNETPGSFELLEPTSPEALVPDSWVEPWMFILGFALLAVLLSVVIFKKKKAAVVDPRALREAAHSQAVAALSQMEPVPAREAAVQSSLILRHYLAKAAGDPALFETHEETISRHEALKDFSEQAKAAAGRGFARLASLKYAPEIPDVAASEVIDDSRALLETLHHGFRA